MTEYLPRIVSLVSLRGPCGKTTLACSLGTFLAGTGKRMVVLDLDPKLAATAALLDRTVWDQSILDVVNTPAGSGVLLSALQPTGWPNLWVLPGSGQLGRVDREMVGGAVQEIQRELGGEALSGIILDTPPVSGPLLAKIIAVSDYLLLPFVPASGSLFAARNAIQATLEYAAENCPRPFGLVPFAVRADEPAHAAFIQSMESFLRSNGDFGGAARLLPPFPFLPDLLNEGAESPVALQPPLPFKLPPEAIPSLREIASAAGFHV